jgi:hypothetical protein
MVVWNRLPVSARDPQAIIRGNLFGRGAGLAVVSADFPCQVCMQVEQRDNLYDIPERFDPLPSS